MANLNGSFPGLVRLRVELFSRGWLGPWLLAVVLGACVGPAQAEVPAYLKEALAAFSPGVPPGWAYTLKTEREDHQILERFDPAKPEAEQWTLLLTEGRPPDPQELAKYVKFKAGQTAGAAQGTFQKSDIEPGSLTLLSEDARRAEYSCSFRELSANSDKMLGHLALRLLITKRPAHVEKYTLELLSPYSPVLGVKMRELVVTQIFSPPEDVRPSLPWRGTSHFRGRMFLFPVEENLRTTYSGFAKTP